MLIFNGGGMVMIKDNQPPSKMSTGARFRGWWDGGAEEQSTTIKNELAHSFSMIIESGKLVGNNLESVKF